MKTANFFLYLILIFALIYTYKSTNRTVVSPKYDYSLSYLNTQNEYPETLVIQESAFPEPIEESYLEGDYGVMFDGTFYVHQKLIPLIENPILVILPKNAIRENGVVIENNDRMLFRMLKDGDYYVARPHKVDYGHLFYFMSDWICYPTMAPDKFSGDDLARNQYGGYLLKRNSTNSVNL